MTDASIWIGLIGVVLVLASCDSAPPADPNLTVCQQATYDDWETSDYVLPYPAGRSYLVLQGNCGGFSHTQHSRIAFAYDFRMPIGEVLVAARGGTVLEVEESFEDFDNVRGHENGVVIDHGDGTIGVYLHVTQDGAIVEVGDRVVQGDTIGYSGHTGFSTEPHLHFDVRRGCDPEYNCDSVPVTFRNTQRNPRGLGQGGVYRAL